VGSSDRFDFSTALSNGPGTSQPKRDLRPSPSLGRLAVDADKGEDMANVSTRTLQLRLLILVFVAFFPALGFFWYVNGKLRSLQLEAKEQELVRRAQTIATEYRLLLDESRRYLSTLAEFPETRSGRSATCTGYLQRALAHAEEYTTLSLIGMDGYLACGAVTPEGDLYLGDRAYFTRASSRNAFAVGDFALGRISGLPVLGVAQPIQEEGQVAWVLAASLDLGILGDRAQETELPEGYTFTVLDLERRVMVRLPRTGDFTLADSIGALAQMDFPSLPEGRDPVIVSGTDLDDMVRLFAVAPLRGATGGPQGYLAFGRTQATLMEEVDAVADMELRYLAGGALALLILAWVLGHFWVARAPKA